MEIAYGADSLALSISNTAGSPRERRKVVTAPGGGGHGLVGMRERAEIYGGRLEAGPSASGGFRVAAQFPLERVVG